MSNDDRGPGILITRLSAIGDCILTLPVVCALRDHFPRARIAWAVEPLAASLIGRHRAVDETVIVPKGWLKSPRAIRSLRARLRSLDCRWTVDPQSLTKSSMLAWLSGAPNRVGFARPRGREVAPWLNNIRVTCASQHLVDASLELLRPLGVPEKPTVRFDVPTDVQAIARTERFLHTACLTGGFAVVISGVSWPSRQWPADRLGQVARHLGERHNLPTVVTWAGAREESRAREILEKSGGHAYLAPKTDLTELAALLSKAVLVVGSDTGPLHLAAAVGTPCVGLHAVTRAESSGPYGTQHATVQVDCPRIRNRRRRKRDDSAIRLITVESVYQACDRLLLRRVHSHRHATHAA